jgi:AICAR transformylase/IMP cyclohydrolase PurH
MLLAGDPVSALVGILISNVEIDVQQKKSMIYSVRVVIAPSFDKAALEF